MELTGIHLLSLMITLLFFMALGLYASRQVKSADDFSLGGRSASSSIVSGTIVGTIIGGAATMGTAQLAFCVGLSAWWFTLGSGIGLLIMAAFYAKPLRSTGLATIPQFLVFHYGRTSGPITSIVSSIGIFFSIVASMLTSFCLISALLGVRPEIAACITVLIVLAYVFFGGIKGTGLAGIFKTGLLYITLLIAGTAAFSNLGGLSGIQASFTVDPWLNLFGRGFWLDIKNAFSLIIGIICTQTYAQAIFSARDTRTAIVGSLVAASLTIPVGIPSVMIGLFMRANYPDILPINALPMYLINFLPAWIGGAAIAALFLSAIGSAAGLALGIGTMISGDIVKGMLGISESKKLLWVNRSCVLIVTLCAALFVLNNMDSLVLDWNFLSMALRGAGIFVPLTLAIVCPGKLTPKTATCSMIVGIAASLSWNILFPEFKNPLFSGLGFSLAVIIIGMVLTRPAPID